MKSYLRSIVAVAGVSCLAASGHALIIDNFTEGLDTLTLTGTGSLEGQESGFSIAGMQRDTLLLATSNPFSQPIILNISGNPTLGASFYNGGVGTMGAVQFDYDGFDVEGNNGVQIPGPGMGLNLSSDASFRFTFLSADGPIRIDVMAVTYGSTDRVSVGTFTTGSSITSSTNFDVAFSSLALGSGSTQQFNPGDVDRLVFRFTPVNPSGDFALGSISTAPVPEPVSLAVLGIGLVGVLRLKRTPAKR